MNAGRNLTKEQNLELESNVKRVVRKEIRNWINTAAESDEKFFPLHFASFHGNVKLLKLLCSNGANIKARNS
jgi:ankyrin repeat protein